MEGPQGGYPPCGSFIIRPLTYIRVSEKINDDKRVTRAVDAARDFRAMYCKHYGRNHAAAQEKGAWMICTPLLIRLVKLFLPYPKAFTLLQYISHGNPAAMHHG